MTDPGQVDALMVALVGAAVVAAVLIAMIIMHQGQQLGPEVVPDTAYSAMVVVSIVTCLLAPMVLHPMLNHWPQQETKS